MKNKECNVIYEMIKILIFAMFFSFVSESTVGNFRFFESFFFDDVSSSLKIESGIKCVDNKCHVTQENAYFEWFNLEGEVKNVEIQLDDLNKDKVRLKIELTDEANSLWYEAGSIEYYQNIEQSHIIRIHSSGKTKGLRIWIMDECEFSLGDMELNSFVPWRINPVRFAVFFLVFAMVLVLNPKSALYRIKLTDPVVKPILIASVIFLSLIFYKLSTFNYKMNAFVSLDDWSAYYSQYKNLAEAFAKGQLHLDLNISEELLKLTNPYDFGLRMEKFGFGVNYYHDYAFFQGKYYSYFGALPCLLFYLPYYLLTGTHISNYVVVAVCASLFVSSAFFFVYQLSSKYFSEISAVWCWVFSVFLVFSSGMITALGNPTFYNIPILLGLSLSLFGLSFWISVRFWGEL